MRKKEEKKNDGKSPEGVSNAMQCNANCMQVAKTYGLFEAIINNMLTLTYYLSTEHTKARAHQ